MEDLSLHLLDVAENSLRAGASRILIRLELDEVHEVLRLTIEDDGVGIGEPDLQSVTSPFYSFGKGKRFGFGLSLLKQAAEDTGGTFTLESSPGAGTTVSAIFHTEHPDMKPLGDLASTINGITAAHPEVDVKFEYGSFEYRAGD